MLQRFRRTGESQHRDEAVERFLPLARHVARRFQKKGEPYDDLLQVASLALVNAVDRFDPERGTAFATFAVPTITGELRRHFRDHTWSVRPPRDLLERSLQVEKVAAERDERGRAPTVTEIARRLDCDEEEVLDALHAAQAYTARSFDAPIARADPEEGGTLGDLTGSDDEEFDRAEDRVTLDALLRGLPPRDLLVLRLRFEEDMTQSEIGELIGVSQMQVSRIVRQALQRLREHSDAIGARAELEPVS